MCVCVAESNILYLKAKQKNGLTMIIIFFIMLNLIQMDCRLSEMVVIKTILDFEHFYQGLISVTESFDIEYDLEYIMSLNRNFQI